MKNGRRQSIPRAAWPEVFRLYSLGHGYRVIANMLQPLGVCTTKSSVERLIKGSAPYEGRRVRPGRQGRSIYLQLDSPGFGAGGK